MSIYSGIYCKTSVQIENTRTTFARRGEYHAARDLERTKGLRLWIREATAVIGFVAFTFLSFPLAHAAAALLAHWSK